MKSDFGGRPPPGAGLLLAAAVLSGAAPVPAPTPAPAASASVAWKSSVTAEGARPGDKLQEAEIWLVGDRMRIDDRTPGIDPANELLAGGVFYSWKPGATAGIRLALGLARQGGRPLHDYARRIPEIRARGRVTGSEKIDGRACDVVELETPEDGKGTYWLARELRDFPLRIRVEKPGVYSPYRSTPLTIVKLEYRNRDVRFPAGIDGAELAPPRGVRFEDATQIFLNRGRPFPR